MTKNRRISTGLEQFIAKCPLKLRNKRIGLLCHAASITGEYIHAINALLSAGDVSIGAIFGPQHGLFGQTQDNMIEWEGGYLHPKLGIPVYSLYGKTRKPTLEMVQDLEAFIIDLQDVGARPYTYIWTIKLCMERCSEAGIPVWILDRPNPIAAIAEDGPMLEQKLFTFVGGAEIPLCHRATLGELSLLIKKSYFPSLDLQVIPIAGWWRNSLFSETGLPWVIPSPNMPALSTAIVYPGMVLLEATNISEGRGTVLPFELLGAPFIQIESINRFIDNKPEESGFLLREHNFIPTFNKWNSQLCNGFQIHVVNPRIFKPVETTLKLIHAIIHTTRGFQFKAPPYEYEYEQMPFDILVGNNRLRKLLENSTISWEDQREEWETERSSYHDLFKEVALYPETIL